MHSGPPFVRFVAKPYLDTRLALTMGTSTSST